MSTQILFTVFLTRNHFSKRPDDRRSDTLNRDRLALRRVARWIVVQQAAAALAAHHRLIVATVAQIVPALRPHHHLAGHTFLIERFRNRRPLGLRDAVVGRERAFAYLRAFRLALFFNSGEQSLVLGDGFGRSQTFTFQSRYSVGKSFVGEPLLRLQPL